MNSSCRTPGRTPSTTRPTCSRCWHRKTAASPARSAHDSTFDQRNRIVLSGVYQSGDIGESGSAKHAILSGWTVAPILEWSSGRPSMF